MQATRFAVALAVCASALLIAQQKRDGYKDTPILPGQKWHVHDPDRPYPKAVTPAAAPGGAPSDAIVLFDGRDLSKWTQKDRQGNPVDPKWTVRDGYVEVKHGTGDLITRESFGSCQLHIEYQEPEGIVGESQERGNSGVYLMSTYEIQVLDSYRAATYADGQAGAIYGQWPPLVNPARPPGEWNVFDVAFEAPQFDAGKVVKPAYITLFFNGVIVHNHMALNGPTEWRVILPYKPHGELPLKLQDHASSRPVRYRNIWIRRQLSYDQPE